MFVKWTEDIFSQHSRASLNHFEHNLEVWRQLWRAVERSDLAVFVVDSRMPLFHFQEAMWDYVTKDMGREAIICINKVASMNVHAPAHARTSPTPVSHGLHFDRGSFCLGSMLHAHSRLHAHVEQADLIHPHLVHIWIEYFKKRLPGVPVVAFYAPKSSNRSVGQPCVQE